MSFRQHREVENKPTRYYSDIQEKNVAKAIGGRQTANSGATPYDKGDVKTDNILIECKTKTSASQSISIKKEWLSTLKNESIFMKKDYYSLIFNFGPDEDNYAIIPEYMYKQLFLMIENGELQL